MQQQHDLLLASQQQTLAKQIHNQSAGFTAEN